MFRTISRSLLLLCMLPFAVAQQPPVAAPTARSATSIGAREISLSTWCHFNSGPSAGSTRNLAPQPAQTVGSACHDQDGNSGIIIENRPTKMTSPHPVPMPMPAPPPPPPAPVPAPQPPPPLPVPAPLPHPQPTHSIPPPPPPPPVVMEDKQLPKTSPKPPQVTPGNTGSESPATAPPTAELSYGQRVGDWYKQLKQGNIEYNVPQKMVWKVASTVTVVIHGYQAPKTSALPEATGSGTLKVSDRMKVKLLCPDHPDEFTITNEDSNDDVRYVPSDSTTTWR